MKLLATILGLADQIRAAILIDTKDMRAADRSERSSDPPTTVDQVARKVFAPRAVACVERMRSAWGHGGFLRAFAPGAYRDPALVRSFARYERLAASPATAFAVGSVVFESDVRHVLPAIRVPTLVITHVQSAMTPPGLSRYLAEHVPGARHLELPGSENLMTWIAPARGHAIDGQRLERRRRSFPLEAPSRGRPTSLPVLVRCFTFGPTSVTTERSTSAG